MWLDEAGWAPLFVNGSAKDMASIGDVVRASQFAQAEAYRFIYQSGRRKKPHRSLLATWTFDEPWPNAEHGSIIDYYGRPKMAYYAVKQACSMVDISLSYSDAWTAAGEELKASLWLDNEFPHEIRSPADFTYKIEYFDISGVAVAPTVHGTRQARHTISSSFVLALTLTNLHIQQLVVGASSNLGVSEFTPPLIDRHDMVNGSVIVVRTSLVNSTNGFLMVSHDYTFAVAVRLSFASHIH